MPRLDFADPGNRTRVEQLTRADDSILEIVLGSISILRFRSQLAREIPLRMRVRTAHDQHFTCQRKPTRTGRMGIGNGSESAHAVKGVEGRRTRFFCRSRYQHGPLALSTEKQREACSVQASRL